MSGRSNSGPSTHGTASGRTRTSHSGSPTRRYPDYRLWRLQLVRLVLGCRWDCRLSVRRTRMTPLSHLPSSSRMWSADTNRRRFEPTYRGSTGYCQPVTFSIVARSPDGQSWGVAVASRFLAVGAVVPAAAVGVGAIATQAFANLTYR